jgi:hypothetical protein
MRRGRDTPSLRELPVSTTAALACDHVQEATTHYDVAEKLLSFVLVCQACGTEKLVDALHYEPRFEPREPATPIADEAEFT